MSASAVPSTTICPLSVLQHSVWKLTRLPLHLSTVTVAVRLSPTYAWREGSSISWHPPRAAWHATLHTQTGSVPTHLPLTSA
jgi:hypothetical protein